MSEKKVFDLEDVYDEEIAPLMTKIIEVCKKHELPMLCSFQFEHSETQGPGFCTSFIPRKGSETDRGGALNQALQAIRGTPPFIAFSVVNKEPQD